MMKKMESAIQEIYPIPVIIESTIDDKKKKKMN